MADEASTEKPRKKWLKWTLIGVGGVLVLLLVTAFCLRLHYSDAYFKAKLEASLQEALGRDVSISKFELGLFSGEATISGLSIRNAKADFGDQDSLRVATIQVKASVWGVAMSGGKNLDNVQATLSGLEVFVERRVENGVEVTNFDDLIEKFSKGPKSVYPKDLGFTKLNADVTIKQGIVRFRDTARQLGESRIENLDLNVKQPGLGQPAALKGSMTLITLDTPKGGTLDLTGAFQWIDAQSRIGPDQFKELTLDCPLKTFDLPYLTRHLGLRVQIMDRRLDATLGKPVSGTIKLSAPTLNDVHLEGALQTDGLISLFEKGKFIAGNNPAAIKFTAAGAPQGGVLTLNTFDGTLALRNTPGELAQPADANGLDFSLKFNDTPGQPPLIVSQSSGEVKTICDSDVGAALQLKDRFGGHFALSLSASADPQKGWVFSLDLQTKEDAYALYAGAKSPLIMLIQASGKATLNAQGNPESAVAQVTVKSNSATLSSTVPFQIDHLDDPTKLTTAGEATYEIKGPQLGKDFGPLFKIFNLTVPAENLVGKVKLASDPGRLKLTFFSVLNHPTGDPEPAELVLDLIYAGQAFVSGGGPYLTYAATLSKKTGALLDLAVQGQAVREGQTDTLSNSIKASGTCAALGALRARIAPYLPMLDDLQRRLEQAIPMLGDSTFKLDGRYSLSGTTTVKTTYDAKNPAAEPLNRQVDCVLTATLTDLAVQGPPIVIGKALLNWKEPSATLTTKLTLTSGTSNEPTLQGSATLDSSSVKLKLDLDPANLAKLGNACAAPFKPQALADALPGMKLSGSVPAATLTQLGKLGLLPDDAFLRGNLTFEAHADAAAKTLDVPALGLDCPAYSLRAKVSPLDSATLLQACVAGTAKGAPWTAWLPTPLPTFDLTLNAKAETIAELKNRGALPLELPLNGQLALQAHHDGAGDLLTLQSLAFAGDEGKPSFIKELRATGELVSVREALTNPPATPDALLKFLGKEFRIVALRADGPTLGSALQAYKIAPGFAGDLLSGVYALKDFALANVTLRPGKEAGTLEVGAEAAGELRYFPRPTPNAPPVKDAAFTMSGAWGLNANAPLVLKFSKYEFECSGGVVLDKATLASASAGSFAYSKPVGVPCRIKLNKFVAKADGSYSLDGVALEGGPVEAAAAALKVSALNGKLGLKLDQATLKAPLACTLTNLVLDEAQDKLSFKFEGPKLDLAQLSAGTSPLLALPGFRLSDSLLNVSADYDGRYSVFTTLLFSAADKFNFKGEAKDSTLTVTQPGKTARITLNGSLSGDNMSLTSSDLAANLEYLAAGGGTYKHSLALGATVSASDNRLLLAALKAPGLPLLVKGSLEARGPVHFDGLLGTLGALAGPPDPKAAPSNGDLSAIKNLRLELNKFSAPQLNLYEILLSEVSVTGPEPNKPGLTFDKLAVGIYSAQAKVCGGSVTVTNATYDLSGLPKTAIKHEEHFKGQHFDLNQIIGTADKKDDTTTRYTGTFDVEGALKGVGFSGGERTTWNGTLKVTLPDLVIQKPKSKSLGWTGFFTKVAAIADTRAKLVDQDFGLDLTNLAFEPTQVDIAVINGEARIAKGELVAKGSNAGLKVAFSGTLDLAYMRFDPRIDVWFTNLPPSTLSLMGVDKVSAADQAAFKKDLADGKYKIGITGPISSPTVSLTTAQAVLQQMLDWLTSHQKGGAAPPAPKKNDPGSFLDFLK